MLKQEIMNTTLFHFFQHYFNLLVQLKQNNFVKLISEIEIIDFSYKQLLEQESIILKNCLTNWIQSDRYIKVIKIYNGFQNNLSHYSTLIDKYDLFFIIQNEDLINYSFKNKIQQIQFKQEKSLINQNQITCLIKFSQCGQKIISGDQYIDLFQLFYCVFPQITMTMKHISQKTLTQLALSQTQSYESNEIYSRIISLFDIIQWKDSDQLELLLGLISEKDAHMYRTPGEYFDLPQDINYLQHVGECTTFIKSGYKFICIKREDFKYLITFVKLNDQLYPIEFQINVANILQQYCQISNNLIIIIEGEQNFDINNFEQLCSENPKLFQKQQFLTTQQQNSQLVNDISKLYLQMQFELKYQLEDSSNTQSQELSLEQENFIINQFRQLLMKKFIIDKL